MEMGPKSFRYIYKKPKINKINALLMTSRYQY
jgi:hypothetical protein